MSLLNCHQREGLRAVGPTIFFRPRTLHISLPYLYSWPSWSVLLDPYDNLMSAAFYITLLALVPVLFFGLAFLRSTLLSKYLDDPHTKRQTT